jgi:hypothetical protein
LRLKEWQGVVERLEERQVVSDERSSSLAVTKEVGSVRRQKAYRKASSYTSELVVFGD